MPVMWNMGTTPRPTPTLLDVATEPATAIRSVWSSALTLTPDWLAAELVLETGAVSAEHVLNVLGRLNASPPPDQVETALHLTEAPRADTGRYDGLRDQAQQLRLREHDADELSHYSSGTADVEFLFPWGWDELEGIANRGNYDLTQHQTHSGQSLEYYDQAANERYLRDLDQRHRSELREEEQRKQRESYEQERKAREAERQQQRELAERLGFTRRRDPDAPDIMLTEKRLA